jgi:hypothetical protein
MDFTRAALVALALAVAPAYALTWTNANQVTALTIALYHFDEGSGSTADNAEGTSVRDLALEETSMWRAEPSGWMGSGETFISTSNAMVASTLSFGYGVDWGFDDLTLSFWFRSHGTPSAGEALPEPPGGDWGARCGAAWSTNASLPLVLSCRGIELPVSSLTGGDVFDGAWHHCAMVYDASAQTASVYVDNVVQTNIDVSAGETDGTLTALHIGEGPAGAVLSVDDIDELLVEQARLTDFSNGNPVPEPFGGVAAAVVALATTAVVRVRGSGFRKS